MHYVNPTGLLSSDGRMNIYRGCTHGCIYCDSRSECYQMKHSFEDIEVKINAPELLYNSLSRKRKKCMISTGSMSDPYMPCENRLGLTRKCAEIALNLGFGFSFITKSDLFLRDIDLLKSINEKTKCVVQMTMTTHDDGLCRLIEPGVCVTSRRAEALSEVTRAGIPAVVWMTPILPFINDTEENIRGILDYCFFAKVKGIICFNMGVTMRRGNREYFYASLDRYFPGVKKKYIEAFGNSYECVSPNNQKLMRIFREECRKAGIMYSIDEIFRYIGEFPGDADRTQLSFI